MLTGTILLMGLAALLVGVEQVLRSTAVLARAARVSEYIYGATVVALVTNAPELGVNGLYAWHGNTEAVVGNIIGSNVFNVLAVLGLAGVLGSYSVDRRTVRQTLPALLVGTLLLFPFALDGALGRLEGMVLFFAGFAFIGFWARPVPGEVPGWVAKEARAVFSMATPGRSVPAAAAGILVGLLLILLGSWLVVTWGERLEQSSMTLTRALVARPTLFGLSVLALWTSLPELGLAVAASLRDRRELVAGAIFGSCILNLTLSLGSALVLRPSRVPIQVLSGAFPLAVIVTGAAFGVVLLKPPVSRVVGGALMASYGAFLMWLGLDTIAHPSARILFYGICGVCLMAGFAPFALSGRFGKEEPSEVEDGSGP